jgi:hypothetical protein
VVTYFFLAGSSPAALYAACFTLGATSGYWAVLVTVASEQFGTNLRATAASTVPNFIRGALIPLTTLFQAWKAGFGIAGSAMAVGAVALGVAFVSLFAIEETYGKNLDYLES